MRVKKAIKHPTRSGQGAAREWQLHPLQVHSLSGPRRSREGTGHQRGVEVRGAWLDGPLDLTACKILIPLNLFDSVIDGDVVLRDADCAQLNLEAQKSRAGSAALAYAVEAACSFAASSSLTAK